METSSRKSAMKRRIVLFLMQAVVILVMSSCHGGKHGKPTSVGQPYEVVLEGDTDSVVTRILTADAPGLPQPEPMFCVIQVRKGKTSSLYQMVRNRVVVDVDARHQGLAVKKMEDVNAFPQVVIRISAQSVDQLKARLDGQRLRQLIDQYELRHLATVTKQNVEKQKEVKALFGIDMKIPMDMEASKKGKDFMWISNNANSGMQSLLFLRLRRGSENVKGQVDSLLRKNMVGETDEMYMRIPNLAERGLWEMEGDAMGGPYVMRLVRQVKGKDDIVVIGFVYAPEMNKKKIIKQLEAVLTTIQQ